MKRVNYISSAAGDENSKLSDMLGSLKDDFDYVVAGLEKLDRTGAEASNEGLIIAERFQTSIQEIIADISEAIS